VDYLGSSYGNDGMGLNSNVPWCSTESTLMSKKSSIKYIPMRRKLSKLDRKLLDLLREHPEVWVKQRLLL
jgi:hypothetical protein